MVEASHPVAEQARALRDTVGVRILPEARVLVVSGADARSWLNGQVTNDLGKAVPGSALYALRVGVRGKIISDLWITDGGDGTFLLAVSDLACGPLLTSLEHHIIMEDVSLHLRDDLRIVTAQGPQAQAALAQAAAAPPQAFHTDRLGRGGVDVVTGVDGAEAAAETLTAAAEGLGGCRVGEEGWELARLRAAIPQFGRDFGEESYPQEAGLGARAVSFQKGCYVGQEVVFKIEKRGRVSRCLVLLAATEPGPVCASDAVHDAAGTTVGEVTSSTADPEAQGCALALARLRSAATRQAAAVNVAGVGMTVQRILG